MKARNRGAHADRVRQEPRGRTGRKRRRRLMRTQEVDRMRPPIRQVWRSLKKSTRECSE